jgi:hypothetical protein
MLSKSGNIFKDVSHQNPEILPQIRGCSEWKNIFKKSRWLLLEKKNQKNDEKKSSKSDFLMQKFFSP